MQPWGFRHADFEQFGCLAPCVVILYLDQESVFAGREVGVDGVVVFAGKHPHFIETFEHIGIFHPGIVVKAGKSDAQGIIVVVEVEPFQEGEVGGCKGVVGIGFAVEGVEFCQVDGYIAPDSVNIGGYHLLYAVVTAEIDVSFAVGERTFFVILVACDAVVFEVCVDAGCIGVDTVYAVG